jgi:hypothetical protein
MIKLVISQGINLNQLPKAYFCNNCKKVMGEKDQVLLVQDNSNQYFCSEKCIISFFKVLSSIYESYEQAVRDEFHIDTYEEALTLLTNERTLNDLLEKPTHIYDYQLDQIHKGYVHVLLLDHETFGRVWAVAFCFYYSNEPSFIFHKTVTTHENIYRSLIPTTLDDSHLPDIIEDDSEDVLMDLPDEVVDQVSLLKSIELALYMEHVQKSDIALEKHHDYESYIPKTLDEPDEVFTYEFDDGSTGFSYIRSYKKDKKTFFYVVLALDISKSMPKEKYKSQMLLFPVFSFPSLDHDLYQEYNKGERVKGNTKN